MSITTSDRVDIGRVIGRTGEVLRADLVNFGVLALAFSAAPRALVALAQARAIAAGHPMIGAAALFSIVALLGGVLLQAGVIFGSVADLNGQKASLGDLFRTSFRSALPLMGVGVISGFAVVVGLILLIAPGIFVALMLAVAAPVCVVERAGVFGSLERSQTLTRNHRWSILVLGLVLFAISIAVQIVFGLLVLVSEGAQSGFDLTRYLQAAARGPGAIVVNVVLQPLISAALSLLGAAGGAALYFELRSVKEGVGAEALAATFA